MSAAATAIIGATAWALARVSPDPRLRPLQWLGLGLCIAAIVRLLLEGAQP